MYIDCSGIIPALKIGVAMRQYFLFPLALTLVAQEIPTTLKDQQSLAVTIYNSNLALVKDQREVRLPRGLCQLAFQEVSAQIRPETAILSNLTSPKDFWIAEQNFDFDLLTPQKLLEKYVGEKVKVISTKPSIDGGTREAWEEATVLATNSGVVLQFEDRIETSAPGRIVYPNVPANLRARPTLVMTLNSPADRAQKLELSYLTGGLSWRADYVASLSTDEKSLDLSGWVTLTNQSGAAYPNAALQLVAGDVNRVSTAARGIEMADRAPMMTAYAAAPQMSQESLFEYHLYTLDRPTTLKENQTKQVAMLSASNVPVGKEYILRDQSSNRLNSQSIGWQDKLKVGVFVGFDNKESSSLGKPLPKGIVRVYKKDNNGRAQFIGEDAIDHTPKNEAVRLKLGDAFDITARRRQTHHSKMSENVFEAANEIEIKNAKNEAVTVNVFEQMPGDFVIWENSHPQTKENSRMAKFLVTVPAEGSATLKYRVRVTN